jgi:hypothetical protein
MMSTEERQQRMAERILEDEHLRGDLEDDAATALIDWASKRAAAVAADSANSDAAVEAQVQAIRQAAGAAARSGETAPKRLIALAAAKLAPSQDTGSIKPPAAATAAAGKPELAKEVPAAGDSVSPSAKPAAEAPATQGAATASAAQPPPSAPLAEKVSGAAPKPAGSSGGRSRRKRSRLARFFKRVLSGR